MEMEEKWDVADLHIFVRSRGKFVFPKVVQNYWPVERISEGSMSFEYLGRICFTLLSYKTEENKSDDSSLFRWDFESVLIDEKVLSSRTDGTFSFDGFNLRNCALSHKFLLVMNKGCKIECQVQFSRVHKYSKNCSFPLCKTLQIF